MREPARGKSTGKNCGMAAENCQLLLPGQGSAGHSRVQQGAAGQEEKNQWEGFLMEGEALSPTGGGGAFFWCAGNAKDPVNTFFRVYKLPAWGVL